jgi:hypothetical protein
MGSPFFWRFIRFFLMPDQRSEVAVGPVHLTVNDLPNDVAQRIREVQVQDPEFLRRILLYGITHKTIFETLSRGWSA